MWAWVGLDLICIFYSSMMAIFLPIGRIGICNRKMQLLKSIAKAIKHLWWFLSFFHFKSMQWTLWANPRSFHFSSAACSIGSDRPVGTLYPEDPLAAVRHSKTSHLLNLDFLNLPTAWHIDKQPWFLVKVGKAHSLAVNCFVVLNHKNGIDSVLSNLSITQGTGS